MCSGVVLHLCKGRFLLACVRVCVSECSPLNYKSRLPPIFSMIVLVYSRPLTSKLAETLSCLNRDLTACPSRLNTSQEFPLPWPKGLIDFWLVVLFKPLYSMTSSFEWQLIRLHNSMGICLDTGNLHKVPIRDRYAGLPIKGYLSNRLEITLLPRFFVFWDRDIKFWAYLLIFLCSLTVQSFRKIRQHLY